MQNANFSIGIWGVVHPVQRDEILEARERCRKLGIDFRMKEFLGEYEGELYGTYKYEGACDKKFIKECYCKTTELIIGSGGNVYRCHSDLYEGSKPIGNILSPEFELEDRFRYCSVFRHTSVEIKVIKDLVYM